MIFRRALSLRKGSGLISWGQRSAKAFVPAIALLALALWLRPYILSTYYLEKGGKLLEASLIPVYPDRLAPEQMVDSAKFQAGVTCLQQAVRWDPRNVQAMRLLARAYLSSGQREAALQILQEALTVRPEYPLLHLELGDVYDNLGYTEDAYYEYLKGGIGSRLLPLMANYLKMADTQIETGSGEVAIHMWYKVLEIEPGNLYALSRLRWIHSRMGDEQQAAIFEQQLRSIDPQTVAVPLDFRLAEYQALAMISLVEDGVWERERVLRVVSNQVQQSDGLNGLMTERVLQVLLNRWPDDQELIGYSDELRQRLGDRDI